jgi:hypothetical protein
MVRVSEAFSSDFQSTIETDELKNALLLNRYSGVAPPEPTTPEVVELKSMCGTALSWTMAFSVYPCWICGIYFTIKDRKTVFKIKLFLLTFV